jgi:hypothetical protein
MGQREKKKPDPGCESLSRRLTGIEDDTMSIGDIFSISKIDETVID